MRKVLPHNAILVPDNAQRVFKGVIFDVYQWPQAMFDGSTEIFEMLRRPDTVQVVVVRKQQILLVRDEQPGRGIRLHFPGGRVDETDESWLATAERELREEAGLVCKDWRLIDVQQPQIKIEWFAAIFLAEQIVEEHPQNVDVAGEKITLEWHDFDKVRERVLSGEEQTMQYLVPFFTRIKNLADLLTAPAYKGKEADR